jgi:hypothetical protein
MNNLVSTPTAQSVKKKAFVLLLMTFFTLIWAGIAGYGLMNSPYLCLLGIFLLVGLFFIYYAIKINNAAKDLPTEPLSADHREQKKLRKWFMIIGTAEGLGIFIAINIAVNLHHPELKMPAMALVVGLHFFPLAKVFKRKLFYFLGAWGTLIAILAIMLSLNKTVTEAGTLALTGIGMAIATATYGFIIIREHQKSLIN